MEAVQRVVRRADDIQRRKPLLAFPLAVVYRVLTVEDVSWRDVFVGAVFAGVVWTVLQALGGYVLGHRLESAKVTYGFFAVVIGLLTWIYLGAQVTPR